MTYLIEQCDECSEKHIYFVDFIEHGFMTELIYL